jgi:hypothetical protein
MRRAWPLIILLAGCRSDVYRGSDLQKIVHNEHSAFIGQQMTLLENGQVAEMVRELCDRARYPAKFDTSRDKVQALLEKSLKMGGRVNSYQIVEAEKIKIKEEALAVSFSVDVPPPGATVEDLMERRANGRLLMGGPPAQDGVIIRVDVQFERGSAEFEYTFFLINGIWKLGGLHGKFWAASK